MDLSVRLDLSDSVVAVGGAVDLQLGAGLMAWHPLPRSFVHRRGLLLLRRRRPQDRSRKGSNLRQPGPGVRGHYLSRPPRVESQPMAWSQLPTESNSVRAWDHAEKG